MLSSHKNLNHWDRAGFANEGEHRWCFGSNAEATSRLLQALPPAVMAVIVTHDLLLPPEKHACMLIDMLRGARGLSRATRNENEFNAMHAVTCFREPTFTTHGAGCACILSLFGVCIWSRSKQYCAAGCERHQPKQLTRGSWCI